MGFELMQTFKTQAEKFGAEIKQELVSEIQNHKDNFTVKTNSNSYQTKTVILAFGLSPRELGVPGEDKLKGRGVAYCATCDGPFFKNKTVAVIGGGNSALDAADYLSEITKKVYLIHRRDEFRAESVLQKKVEQAKNIEIILNSEIAEIKGKDKVESIVIKNNVGADCNPPSHVIKNIVGIDRNQSDCNPPIKIDGVFIEIGYQAKTDWLKNLVKLNAKGEIITDENCCTSIPGIFGAGDVTDAPYKQIVISAGEGAKAALQAHKYIQQKSPKENNEVPDWGGR